MLAFVLRWYCKYFVGHGNFLLIARDSNRTESITEKSRSAKQ